MSSKNKIKSNFFVRETHLYGVYCLTALFISGTFIGIYDLGWKVLIPFFIFFCFIGFFRLYQKDRSNELQINFSNLELTLLSFKEVLIGTVSVMPIFFYLVMTWNQEFPFVGDHDFHLIEDAKTALFWWSFKWQTLFFLLSLWLSIRFRLINWWIPIAAIFLMWWSRYDTLPWHDTSNAFFIRYPAFGRFLSTPFMYLAISVNIDQLYNFSRLINIFLLLAWIYIYRPFFFQRKPNWHILLFCLVFLCQTNVIYYCNTNYLEPISLVFILMAVECLFIYSQENNYIGACLFIGLAAMVKEQAIFILPWFWLAGKPWRWNHRQWARGIIVGIVSAVPFVMYYLIRMQRMGSGRNFAPIAPEQWFDLERYSILFGRLGYHLGVYGIVTICLTLTFSTIVIIRHSEYRVSVLCILGAALTQILFFFADRNSSSYLGYFRFSFIFISLVASICLLTEQLIKNSSVKRFDSFLFVCAAIYLIPFFKNSYTNDMNSNFTEHSDAPIHLPIGKLIKKAESQNLLHKEYRIHITDTTGYNINAAPMHYRRMANLYSIEIDKLLKCSCDTTSDAFMVPFVYFAGMNAGLRDSPPRPSPFAAPPQKMAESWFAAKEKKDQCYKEMKSSCDAVVTEEFNGEIVGLLGVKKHN